MVRGKWLPTALKLLRGDFHGSIQMTTAEDLTGLARWEGEGGGSTGMEAENAEEMHDNQDKGAVTLIASWSRRCEATTSDPSS